MYRTRHRQPAGVMSDAARSSGLMRCGEVSRIQCT